MEALEARVTLIQAEAERLAQYLSTLPPDAWRQPSACQGWEVRNVVAQFYVRTITRGVQCNAVPGHIHHPKGGKP